MSCLVVLGVMDFYPVTPGTEYFAIGAPHFRIYAKISQEWRTKILLKLKAE